MTVDTGARVPRAVRLFDFLVKRLLGVGVPMGPNALITVRGRKTGIPRTTPVALIESGGRRWIQCPFGEANWVRNLRSAGEAILTIGGRSETVTAAELTRAEAASFYAEVLGPQFERYPAPARLLLNRLLGLGEVLADPVAAAERHPVFELGRA